MRPLFTDGWNSMWHFIFGVVAIYVPFIIPVFVLYQVIDWYDENMMIDLLEFFIGYVISYFIQIMYEATATTKEIEVKEIEVKEIEVKEIEVKEIEVKEIEVKEMEVKEIEMEAKEIKIETDTIEIKIDSKS